MKYDEFYRPVSVDFAPRGRVCEWCGQPAERQLTAIGGSCHNRGGAFCHSCGERFIECVRDSRAKAEGLAPNGGSRCVKDLAMVRANTSTHLTRLSQGKLVG